MTAVPLLVIRYLDTTTVITILVSLAIWQHGRSHHVVIGELVHDKTAEDVILSQASS